MKEPKNYRLPACEVLPAAVIMSGAPMDGLEVTTRRGVTLRMLEGTPLTGGMIPTHTGAILLYILADYMRHPDIPSVSFPVTRYTRAAGFDGLNAQDMEEIADLLFEPLNLLTRSRFIWTEEEGGDLHDMQTLEEAEERGGMVSARVSDEFAALVRTLPAVTFPGALLKSKCTTFITTGLAMLYCGLVLPPQVRTWRQFFTLSAASPMPDGTGVLAAQMIQTLGEYIIQPHICAEFEARHGRKMGRRDEIAYISALMDEAQKRGLEAKAGGIFADYFGEMGV